MARRLRFRALGANREANRPRSVNFYRRAPMIPLALTTYAGPTAMCNPIRGIALGIGTVGGE
jgi:hypothetical protein